MISLLSQSINKISEIENKISQIDKKEQENKFTDNMRSMISWLSQSIDKVLETEYQGRSEGASSVAFEVLITKSEIDFINLFIFNCLTSNINLLSSTI